MRGIGILCSPRLRASKRANAREAVANGAETKNDLLGSLAMWRVKNVENGKDAKHLEAEELCNPRVTRAFQLHSCTFRA